MSAPNDESWKIFQRDTEAGRLLSRLYGCPPSSQRVSYPKQRRRRATNDGDKPSQNENTSKGWKTTYTVHSLSRTEEDEKDKERKNNIARALSMRVPKVGHYSKRRSTDGSADAKLDQIPRRKTEAVCKTTVAEVKFQNKKYRPPVSHAFSTDSEKRRISDLFANGGGKALPRDLTYRPDARGSNVDPAPVALPDSLFAQIYGEIVERRAHQMSMERLGAGEASRQTIVDEITIRINQLRRIDPDSLLALIPPQR
jgi:hypothetical protein